MRAISQDLIDQLQSNWQQPKMKVLCDRSPTDLFLVETIHTDTGFTDIDVALKRSTTENSPDEAYIFYRKNGHGYVAKKELSTDPAIVWTELFEVGAARAVAIDFDGYWVRDISTMKFNFVTVGEPWLFWRTETDTLNMRQGDGTNPVYELATDVVKIAAIRGWIPAEAVSTQDQGLIVAYIKSDGLVYYRNYCLQSDLSRIWEVERLVPNLPTSVDNISLFRTNDFRVGFLAEADGQLKWTVTKRNWAGMSIAPENISAGLVDYEVTVIPIAFLSAFSDENISAGITENVVGLASPIYPSVVSITNTLIDKIHITIKFSHYVTQSLIGLQSAFTVKDSDNVNFAVGATAAGENQTELILTTAILSAGKNPITVTYDKAIMPLTCSNEELQFEIDSFATSFTALIDPPKGYAAENLSVGLVDNIVSVTPVVYIRAYATENLSVGLNGYVAAVTKVGNNPL